jgi:MtN3 and saliva related transmembrane protein
MSSGTEILGLAAGFFVALGWVPQVLRVWRLRDAQEISLAFNLLSLGGTALWLAYGLSLGLMSVMVWNSVNLALLMSLLAVKLKFGMGRSTPDDHASAEPPAGAG